MSLSLDEVRRVAELARIALDDTQTAQLADDLNTIVGYVEQLAAVPTDQVEPIANVAGLEHVVRDDEPGPMLRRAALLQNAPQATEQTFLVPKAVDR